MKKNITINLFGALYNIDEDAYDLLFRYQEDMKRYFAGREGGEEIADDIEHRVAELMAELKASGVEAITRSWFAGLSDLLADYPRGQDSRRQVAHAW